MSSRLFQKIVAMITLLAITSSVAWATTPEVLLESMKDEAVLALHLPTSSEAQVAVATATTQADQHDQSLPEQPCNHGCHAASHLLGLLNHGDLTSYIQIDAQIYPPGTPCHVDSPSLKGLYRPPLTTLLI